MSIVFLLAVKQSLEDDSKWHWIPFEFLSCYSEVVPQAALFIQYTSNHSSLVVGIKDQHIFLP